MTQKRHSRAGRSQQKFILTFTLVLLIFAGSWLWTNVANKKPATPLVASNYLRSDVATTAKQQPLAYTGSLQMVMANQDAWSGR